MLLLRIAWVTASLALAVEESPPRDEDTEEQTQTTPSFDDTIVVSVSRLQERLVNAPASVSVLSSESIESSPAQNYGDLLRAIPGVSVVQLSARDINVASRAQNGAIVTSQLALVDGRTVYQDFFGFVSWDLLPIQTSEIDRVELIRGPVSAVWGANAMTGVVNVITKRPRDMEGTTVSLGFGGFDRSVKDKEMDSGSLFFLNATHARAVNDRFAFKVSAGIFTQHPLARPVGKIPPDFETPYPSFTNQGSTQPKLDVRFDYDFAEPDAPANRVHRLEFGGGYAGTEGIIYTGIGPFDIQRRTFLGYGKMNYQRESFKLNVFVNVLDGGAPALLVADIDEKTLIFLFKNRTFDVEVSDFRTLGDRHLLSFGGNFRHNDFDLSLAPRGDSRDEGGAYVQDEIFFSEHFRWIVGGRIDKFDVLGRVVFSPRTAILLKPTPEHTFRLSFNRAFRAPSFVNNFLDTTFLNPINLGKFDPDFEGKTFLVPVNALGRHDLNEESLTAYELGYTGVFGDRTFVSAAFYLNQTRDIILFTPTESYDSENPPPGWPLDPDELEGMGLSSELAFQNRGRVRDRGIELSVQTRINASLNAFANYTWQHDPEPRDVEVSELNLPPNHRFNVGLDFTYGRYFGNVSVNYVDNAFWQDVLDVRFHGPTEPYWLTNAGFGVHWEGGKLTTVINVTNLANSEVQQHVLGDIIQRQIVGELRLRF